MRGTAEAVPAAPEEFLALSDWLEQDIAPPNLLADWLQCLSVPYQRRVLLAALWVFYALAMDISARSDTELPANLATLIPFLLAVATLLSELLEWPSDGD